VALHERAAAYAHPEDEPLREDLAQRPRRPRHRRCLALPYHRNRGAGNEPFGVAEDVRRAYERVTSEGLRKPQCAIAELFQLAGKTGDFAGA
jgi:hypothetical protein